MKRLLLAAALIGVFAFTTADKLFTIKFTEPELSRHWTRMNDVKNIVEQSNLPHQQAKYIMMTIDSLQIQMSSQIQKQLSDTTAKKK